MYFNKKKRIKSGFLILSSKTTVKGGFYGKNQKSRVSDILCT